MVTSVNLLNLHRKSPLTAHTPINSEQQGGSTWSVSIPFLKSRKFQKAYSKKVWGTTHLSLHLCNLQLLKIKYSPYLPGLMHLQPRNSLFQEFPFGVPRGPFQDDPIWGLFILFFKKRWNWISLLLNTSRNYAAQCKSLYVTAAFFPNHSQTPVLWMLPLKIISTRIPTK